MENGNFTNASMNTHPLVRRMFILIEDEENEKAEEVIDKILNEYPECAEAYLGALMLEVGAHTKEELASVSVDFSENKKYKRALMYAEGELKDFLESISVVSLINSFINVTREEGLDPIEVLLGDICDEDNEEAPVMPEKKDEPISNLNNLVGEEREGDFVYIYKNGHYALSWYKGKDRVVKIPGSFRGSPVTEILRDAFKENYMISEVILPEGMTDIGIFAFFGCVNLKSVTFPKTLRNIGTYSFGKCNALKEINLPDGLEYIGIMAFYNCYGLKNITVPNSVKKIGRDVFRGCKSLCELTVPFLGGFVGADENTLTHFFDGVYGAIFPNVYVPAKLKKVTVTGGDRVSDNAFANCREIVEVYLPASTTYIGKYAFRHCDALETLRFADFGGWHCAELEGEAIQREKNPNNAVAIFNSSQCAKIFKGDGAVYYWFK